MKLQSYFDGFCRPPAFETLKNPPQELAKLAVLTEILDAAGGGPRRSPGRRGGGGTL